LPGQLSIFVPDMAGGGAQRSMLNLARGIAAKGFATDLVLARAEGPYLTQVPETVRLMDLQASRVLFSLPALVRYLRREQPEAMLSALNYANVVALWARRLAGVPRRVVVSERNTFSHWKQKLPSPYRLLMSLLLKTFYPWADAIVAVSKGVADDLAQATGIPRERIQVIYNPVVTPELCAKAQAPLEHPWFEPGEPPVLLAVGRLTAQKGFSMLIEAFARVRQERLARLVILGEGEERPVLEALVRQLGLEQDVSMPGFVANPYAYMARASLFVLSSSWEGLPAVLIEAQYCGVPVVATDCPSGPREILEDGRYGQLVPVGDTSALAYAMQEILADRMPRLSRASWRPFELESVVQQYISTFSGD
jgi:glycosyltransferase involved in cell wall biosynthesis